MPINNENENENGNGNKNERQNTGNNVSESIILNLETLKVEYDKTILQYNKAQANYINYLNEKTKNPYKIIKGQAFWGTEAATNSENNDISSVGKCKKLCSDTPNCSGATFNNKDHEKSICLLRTGEGEPVPALENDYAIVKTSDTLIPIKGQAFWGTGAATNSENNDISSVHQCSNLCLSTPNCSGATFNNKDNERNICLLRTGEGSPVPALENDYAIISKQKMYLNILQKLNIRLTEINKQILDIIDRADPIYNQQVDERLRQTVILNKNYKNLLEQRDKINEKIKNFDDLEEEQNESILVINKYYYLYFFLIIIIIIFVIILLKFGLKSTVNNIKTGIQSGGKLSNNTYYIIFGIFFSILVICFIKKIK